MNGFRKLSWNVYIQYASAYLWQLNDSCVQILVYTVFDYVSQVTSVLQSIQNKLPIFKLPIIFISMFHT